MSSCLRASRSTVMYAAGRMWLRRRVRIPRRALGAAPSNLDLTAPPVVHRRASFAHLGCIGDPLKHGCIPPETLAREPLQDQSAVGFHLGPELAEVHVVLIDERCLFHRS
jgi:hypothetical protein